MTVTFSYTISNEVNFEDVGLGDIPDPLTTLTPIYGNRDWSFDITFTADGGDANTFVFINNIETTTPPYADSTYDGFFTVTISKKPDETIFPGEQYRFVKFQTQELFTYIDVDNIQDGLSVIGWDTPTEEVVSTSYTFTITYDMIILGANSEVANTEFFDQTAIITLGQELYWDYEPGWTKLLQLVASSEK